MDKLTKRGFGGIEGEREEGALASAQRVFEVGRSCDYGRFGFPGFRLGY